MNEDLNGYVVFCKEREQEIPYGVVSNDFECKAYSNYIPTNIKDYLVQIEDRRFFEHHGIDLIGISRALMQNIKAGKVVQGGSTITQQLARNILKDNSKTISRKLRETYKAFQIESKYTKDEILNLYFNNVYFGKNLRGIRAAGLYYFGKDVDKLKEVELMYLLTILRGPNYYLNQPEKSRNRFEFINKELFERKIISKKRYRVNLRSKITLNDNTLQTVKKEAIPFITSLYWSC